MRSHMRNRTSVAGMTLAALLLFGCVPARAADARASYDDGDANYLKVAYHFLYPVGKLAEILVFRPLHAVAVRTQPIPSVEGYEERESGRCITFRPARSCTRD